MKPSTAIEICLTAPIYYTGAVLLGNDTSFMCNALHEAKRQGLVTQEAHDEAIILIYKMMEDLLGYRSFAALVNVLRRYANNLGDPEHLEWVWKRYDDQDRKPMMRQFYCWFVFDLKRRGL